MDLMQIRRGLLAQMAGQKVISGSFTPTQTQAAYSFDTGSTAWTYLVVTPRVYPYAEGTARCLGLKFINLNTNHMISVFGSSSETSTAIANCSSKVIGSGVTINNGVVTFSGTISQVGAFVANCVYDWFAW